MSRPTGWRTATICPKCGRESEVPGCGILGEAGLRGAWRGREVGVEGIPVGTAAERMGNGWKRMASGWEQSEHRVREGVVNVWVWCGWGCSMVIIS